MEMITMKNYGTYFNWLCEGIATSLREISNEQLVISNYDYYTLDGRKLNGKPTTKGLYIHQGKKVVIK